MCGIAGRFNFNASHPVDRERLRAMTTALTHRGPDADGYYVGDGIGLGHRRLSIIDLATGDQPVANEDGTVLTVFNGEIYNFGEIRRELETLGHVFRTNSDTEVIVHGYEQWGPEAVTRFRGMFAIAVWDAPKRRLLLVRDRLGIKPVYYSLLASGLVFGSEIKALLEDPDVSRDWSAESLDAYLALAVRAGPANHLRGDLQAPGRALSASGTWTSVDQAVLGFAVHRHRRRLARRRISRPAGGAAARVRQTPHDQRRAARGVSLGWDRLEPRRGGDGEALRIVALTRGHDIRRVF